MSLGDYPPGVQFGWGLAMFYSIGLVVVSDLHGFENIPHPEITVVAGWFVGAFLLMFFVGPWIHAMVSDRSDT